MGLTDKTLQALKDMGFANPTEVQERVIPIIVGGKEIIARSKTGSGKTVAFGVSIMELLAAGKVRKALIIAPVRELALQIMEELRAVGKYHRYRVICAYGGQNIDVQIKMIYNGVDVLVATPGRLLDLFERGTIDLNEYDFVVLDEADKMFEMGFIEDIDTIVSNTSYARRVELFSATISDDVQRIAKKYMKQYELIEVGEQEKPPQIEEEKIELDRPQKFDKLVEIIKAQRVANATGKILIFVATQRATEFVGKRLQAMGIDCGFIHGDIRQNRRERIMGGFKEGKSNILVATDVAARGLHIDDIALVVNFDEANDSQTHMHRIGRTGRMGASGKAITFVDKNPYFGRPVRSGFRPKVGPHNPYAGGQRGPYRGGGGGRPHGGGGHGGHGGGSREGGHSGSHGGGYGGYSHGGSREGGGHSGGSGPRPGGPGQHRPRRTHRFTRR